MTYVVGIDPGFASSPTGCALLDLTDAPRLIAAIEFKPRCGGDWQRRCDDILVQLKDWLTGVVLPRYQPLLLAYALPHLRERKDDELKPLRRSQTERANGTKVLNAQTALKLADLGGAFRGLASALSLDCIGVQETESKVALTGRSDADKQMMIDGARQVFGRQLSEHCADACGHGLAGEANWRRYRLVREAQAQ